MTELEPRFSVRSPELARLVDAARDQAIPAVTVTPEQIRRGWQTRRRSRTQSLVAGAAALAACVGLAWIVPSAPQRDGDAAAPVEAVALAAEATPTQAQVKEPAPRAEAAPELPEPSAPPTLASAISIGPDPKTPTAEASVEVREPWRVYLAEGTRRFTVDSAVAGDHTLIVETPGKRLELRNGTVLLRVSGDRVEAELEVGYAEWISDDGSTTPLTLTTKPPVTAPETIDTPEVLARKAERQLAAGRRSAALRTLRKLVTRYPKSTPAKTALVDLAGLLQTTNRDRAAGCAYQLYLKRYPRSPLAPDVRKTLATLGPRIECRGLTPR